ncbi:VC0807 family protein [Acidocella sp.]|uniref:VC0807 family protein n=1 Tax=Acidocella sp. TaxID=50710 RepID=UPI00261CEC31|nr:VC0807 family protein [Acidocella sp.]
MGANFVAPWLVYEAFDARLGDSGALMVSAVPPLLWSLAELARVRRVDAVSATVVASIVLTVGATALGGSARMIQVRDALVTGAVGLLFVLSLPFRRPLIFYLARAAMARRTEGGETAYEAIWDRPGVPAAFTFLTWLWGLGLMAQTALLCGLAYIWPIGRYLLLSPVISWLSFGALFLASYRYMARHPEARVIMGR